MKNNSLLISTILSNTYTKRSALRRTRLLREYLDTKHYAEQGFSLKEMAKDQPEYKKDFKAMENWGDDFFSSFSRKNTNEKIEELRVLLGGLETVTVYLPIEAEDKLVKKLSQWFRKNVDPEILLDLRFDEHAVGGCSVVWNDYYHDYSIYGDLERSRKELLSLIQNYDKQDK